MKEDLHVGDRIRKVRNSLGMTQAQFAAQTGLSLSSLRRYESGERSPTMNVINTIATALNIQSKTLVDGELPRNAHARQWDEAETKLKHIGFHIGFDEDDALLWIECPDGSTFEVMEKDVLLFNRQVNHYMRFLLSEWREKYHH